MFKLPLPAVVVLISAIMFSCTENPKPPISPATITEDTTKTTAEKPNNCDNFINTDTSQAMIRLFKELYIDKATSGKKLTDKYWINRDIFLGLDSLMTKTNRKYNGVWFYFGNSIPTLIIVPSKKTALHNHENAYEARISASPNNGAMINMDSTYISNATKSFGSIFRREPASGGNTRIPVDSLSKAVWMDSTIISTLASYLIDKKINGIMAFSAAYTHYIDDPASIGQRHPRQSTLLFVPTKNTASGPNEIQWELIQCNSKDSSSFRSAVNHSQLCPDICN